MRNVLFIALVGCAAVSLQAEVVVEERAPEVIVHEHPETVIVEPHHHHHADVEVKIK